MGESPGGLDMDGWCGECGVVWTSIHHPPWWGVNEMVVVGSCGSSGGSGSM